MRSLVVLVVLCAAVFASAENEAQIGSSSLGSLPATRLQGSVSFSGSSSGSMSDSLSGSGSGSGSDCQSANPCNSPTSFGGSGGGQEQNPAAAVDDAIKPVEDWLKDFKKRTMGEGNDLYRAAKAVVKPLLKKLKKSQKRALERLVESNEAILRHVEEASTNHIYTLLRADQAKDKDAERKAEQAHKVMDAAQKQKEAQDAANAALGISSEQAAALKSQLASAGAVPSKSVIEKIASILSSESAHAHSAISKALKKASEASSGSLSKSHKSESGSK